MKYFLFLSALFSLNLFAADPVIIDIGGVRHQCTPIGGSSPVQCYNVAYSGPFSRDESLALCSGAINESPARCGISAYRGRFSKADSITLCTGSTTDSGPIDCANLAYNGPFSSSESIELCRNNGTERTAVCALDAYHGPFSKEEAIKMCKNSHLAEGKSNFSKEEINDLIEAANLKAFERKEYK